MDANSRMKKIRCKKAPLDNRWENFLCKTQLLISTLDFQMGDKMRNNVNQLTE